MNGACPCGILLPMWPWLEKSGSQSFFLISFKIQMKKQSSRVHHFVDVTHCVLFQMKVILKSCYMISAHYSGLYSLLVWNYTLETRATIFNKCVLDQSHIMGRNVEQSLDSLCLCPTWLIRVELCTSRTITPQCRGGPSLNKQGWYESHVSWLQEMRDADPKQCPISTVYMWATA